MTALKLLFTACLVTGKPDQGTQLQNDLARKVAIDLVTSDDRQLLGQERVDGQAAANIAADELSGALPVLQGTVTGYALLKEASCWTHICS